MPLRPDPKRKIGKGSEGGLLAEGMSGMAASVQEEFMPSGMTESGLEFGVVLDQFPGGLLVLLPGAAGERLRREAEETKDHRKLAFLVPFQILVEDLGLPVPAKEPASPGETPFPRPEVRDHLLVLDSERFVSDEGRTLQALPFVRSLGELQRKEIAKKIASLEVDHLKLLRSSQSGPDGSLGALGPAACMIVEDPEAEMRDRWIKGLSEEGLQVGDRVPSPQIAEAIGKRMIATDVSVVRVEDLPCDPDGEMAVQQISEVIGAASLVREDDESLSRVGSIHDVPHPVRSECERGRDESFSRVR